MHLAAWNIEINETTLKEVDKHLVDMSGLLERYRDQPESIIDFANSTTPLLFLAGKDDRCVNSVEMVKSE